MTAVCDHCGKPVVSDGATQSPPWWEHVETGYYSCGADGLDGTWAAVDGLRAVPAFTKVGGVEWCVTHQGVVDECGPDRSDDDGNPRCDLYEPPTPCDIRTLYVKGDRS